MSGSDQGKRKDAEVYFGVESSDPGLVRMGAVGWDGGDSWV